MVLLLLLLNALDAAFTLTFLHLGVATELNPITRAAYEVSPLAFVSLKMAAVGLGALLLSHYRALQSARWALNGSVGLYAGIVLYHLAFLGWLLSSP